MRFVLLLFALCIGSPTWAINKCKGPDGKVRYQEAPCAEKDAASEIKNAPSIASGITSGKQMPFTAAPIDLDAAKEVAAGDIQLAKGRMKDPDSAKFEGVRVLRFKMMGSTVVMTCGSLNAKNSFGGYVGFKPFWVYEGVFTETFDHYYPKDNSLTYLMGSIQTACLSDGMAVTGS